MRIPDFFIVGAPKSGTTAMCAYLRQHPEIFIPGKKESHYFGTDLNSPRFIRDREIYLSLFSGAKDEKRVGESSVWYLYSKKAASEIKEFSPSASIIIMLRNPADMLYSQHSQFLYNGNEDIACFEEAINAEDDRKRGLRIPPGVHFIESLFYRETVKYTEQVQRYYNVFGRENVHVIIYDDFKVDTINVYRENLRFLGVTGDFQPEFKTINPNKRVRSNILRNLLQNPPQIARVLGKFFVTHTLHQWFVKKLTSFNREYESRPPMDTELRKRLQAEFASEIERLSELLRRDLTHWCKT
ncbi:MAG: sulfotransferase [Candidatus Brocadia sp.]|nr:sulfotransferase [Candidatus Brocadia sp.]